MVLIQNLNTSNTLSILSSMSVSSYPKDIFSEEQIINNNFYLNSINDSLDNKIQGKIYKSDKTNKFSSLYPSFDENIVDQFSYYGDYLFSHSKKRSSKPFEAPENKTIKLGKKESYTRSNSNENKGVVKIDKEAITIGISVRFLSPTTGVKKKKNSQQNSQSSVNKMLPPKNAPKIPAKNGTTNGKIHTFPLNFKYKKAASPKPSSPTEMHKEMKNGCYIKKNAKNQSLALKSKPFESFNNKTGIVEKKKVVYNKVKLPSLPQNSKNFKRVFNSNANTIHTRTKHPQHKKLKDKLNLSFDNVTSERGRKTAKKEKKKDLNRTFDNIKMENSVFDDDDIFKVLDNTQIIIPNEDAAKLEIIKENNEDLIPKNEDGERITANFMLNQNSSESNNQVFDRFSFHNKNIS